MSVKIYEAYKLPTAHLSGFLSDARDAIISDTADAILFWINSLKPEYVAEKIEEAVQENPLLAKHVHDSVRYRYHLCMVPMLKRASGVSGQMFDSSFNVWVDGQDTYLIPYTRFEFPKPSYLVDFSYWDNTDRPDGIDEVEWEHRAEKWYKLCLDDWDRTRMTYTIVNYSDAQHMGAFEIERQLGLWGTGKGVIQSE